MISEQASFLSPVDMMIVMAVALVVFGPAKLPEVGRQLGQAIRELKKLTGDLTESINNETSDIKSAFDTVSPYKLKPSPIDSEAKLPAPVEGYSKPEAMSESPLLIQTDKVPLLQADNEQSIDVKPVDAVPVTFESVAGEEVK